MVMKYIFKKMSERRDKLSEEELKLRLKNIPIKIDEYEGVEYKLVKTWGIYLDSILFEMVVFKIKELIERDIGIDNFDYVCSVPPCGIPLSASVSFVMKKPLIVPLPPEFRIMAKIENFHNEEQIERGKRILLVDDIINSGSSARITKERLNSINGEFVGLVVVLFNDTFPEKRNDKIKKEESEKIKYLFKVSEL